MTASSATITLDGKSYLVRREDDLEWLVAVGREIKYKGRLLRNAVVIDRRDSAMSDEELVRSVKPLLDEWERMVLAGECEAGAPA